MWSFFRCTVCLFGVVFGVRSAVFGLHFCARCVERRSWDRFRCTVCLFGFDFGALPFRDRFWCVVRWCWGRSQPAGNKIYQDWRGLGGIEPETCRIWGLGPGAWCPFGAFSGWILVRGAPFLGWILVRGMWCADFGADFGARCVVFGVVFGVRSAVFGLHFGARCVERRSWDRFRCTVRLFGFDFGALPFRDRFWCVVRWCWGRSQPAGSKIYQDWRGLGGIEPETCRIWGLGPGAWCSFGWILVRAAPFRARF